MQFVRVETQRAKSKPWFALLNILAFPEKNLQNKTNNKKFTSFNFLYWILLYKSFPRKNGKYISHFELVTASDTSNLKLSI